MRPVGAELFRAGGRTDMMKHRIRQNGIHENGQNKMDEANGQNIAKNKDDGIVSCRNNTTDAVLMKGNKQTLKKHKIKWKLQIDGS